MQRQFDSFVSAAPDVLAVHWGWVIALGILIGALGIIAILRARMATILTVGFFGVLLVVSAGKTKREHARKAKLLLDKVNARLVGTVLNNVRFDSSLQYYYSENQ